MQKMKDEVESGVIWLIWILLRRGQKNEESFVYYVYIYTYIDLFVYATARLYRAAKE